MFLKLQAIQNFLDYFIKLKDWADKRLHEKLILAEESRIRQLTRDGKRPRGKSIESLTQEDFIFSESTDIGLIVSLKGSLQLIQYLIEKCDFKYVMTARFNQDALEVSYKIKILNNIN